MEVHGANTYWHPPRVASPGRQQHPTVGILWEHAAEYVTWLGAAPYIVSGMQLLPFTPAMEGYLRGDWVSRDIAVYEAACRKDATCARAGWSSSLCLERAVLDVAEARACLRALPEDAFAVAIPASNGNSLTNSLHWIATRPAATSASASTLPALVTPPAPRRDVDWQGSGGIGAAAEGKTQWMPWWVYVLVLQSFLVCVLLVYSLHLRSCACSRMPVHFCSPSGNRSRVLAAQSSPSPLNPVLRRRSTPDSVIRRLAMESPVPTPAPVLGPGAMCTGEPHLSG
mmetsp:Transcript_31287/g.65605  ORF Transcript_31287/g.65605 Transcript_31287/m.65605 type:complete len:284 (+) Transcript_31287:2-853(+)